MTTLRDELIENSAEDIVAILDSDPERIDSELAAMWNACLGEGDPSRIIGTAILWCSQQVVVMAVCRCVRVVVDRGPAESRSALDVTERWTRGEASIEEVWDVESAVKERAYRGDAIAQIVTHAAAAAGDNLLGIDDEALRSASAAITALLAIRGEDARAAIVEGFRRTIPPPTSAALAAAHVARNSP